MLVEHFSVRCVTHFATSAKNNNNSKWNKNKLANKTKQKHSIFTAIHQMVNAWIGLLSFELSHENPCVQTNSMHIFNGHHKPKLMLVGNAFEFDFDPNVHSRCHHRYHRRNSADNQQPYLSSSMRRQYNKQINPEIRNTKYKYTILYIKNKH